MQKAPSMTLLDIQNVTVRFGGHTALSSVSMSIPHGSITGLIGPNGAGKTTLFNVINGLQKPDQGNVIFNGKRITGVAPYRRAKAGLGRTFQRLELFPSLTVEENIKVSGEMYRQWGNHENTSLARNSVDSDLERILSITGLKGLANHHVAEIPTGKARLVELARSLMQRPKLILLDEPASGQNDNETSEFGKILLRLVKEGTTIFLVEHDMALVMSVCTKVHVLDFGTVIASGTTQEIQRDEKVINAYLGEIHE